MPTIITRGAGSARSFGFAGGGGGSLYTFTSFTFTNGGQTGASGPSLATLLSSYNTTTYPWLLNTLYFNATSGIQLWTVPSTGNYTIDAYGARGGYGGALVAGLGARILGTFSLTAGDKIRILVGQMGTDINSLTAGGGGGTFIMKETGSSTSDIYVIAGGGGGGYYSSYSSAYMQGSNTTSANPGWSGGYGRIAGAAGTGGGGGGVDQFGTGGGGGGGLTGNGSSGAYGQPSEGSGGYSFTNGGNAYAGESYPGGFGGGGSGDWYSWTGGGGGGGYNGGGGGHYYGPGGGGGSYNNGTSQTNTAGTRNGHGYVTITKL